MVQSVFALYCVRLSHFQRHSMSMINLNLSALPFSNVVNTFLLIYQLGTCCVYVVFVSSNIKSIVDLYVEEKTDVRLYMLIILLPLILINWVRNLKYLAPFSTIANGESLNHKLETQ